MAYKALRAARGGIPGGRDMMRALQRMGMQVKEIEGAKEVVIITNDKKIVIDEPNVSAVTVQGQQIYQIMGGTQREEPLTKTDTVSEEDVRLVSEQAGVSLEEAKKALESTGGDLARAIVELKKGSDVKAGPM
jgi:nascent polypeptide-associated complex subunit alpha